MVEVGSYVSEAGVVGSIISLSTQEAVDLQGLGLFRLDANRIRSLRYYGNQYDLATLVSAMKGKEINRRLQILILLLVMLGI